MCFYVSCVKAGAILNAYAETTGVTIRGQVRRKIGRWQLVTMQTLESCNAEMPRAGFPFVASQLRSVALEKVHARQRSAAGAVGGVTGRDGGDTGATSSAAAGDGGDGGGLDGDDDRTGFARMSDVRRLEAKLDKVLDAISHMGGQSI